MERRHLDRLTSEVRSPVFPEGLQDARTVLEHGPLRRARGSLIRNVTIVWIKHVLDPIIDSNTRRRFLAALAALRDLHREATDTALSEKLTPLVDNISETTSEGVLALLAALPDLWVYIGPATRTKIEVFVRTMPCHRLCSPTLLESQILA